MAQMLLLLESSGSICSVALYDRKEKCLSLRESTASFNHAVEMGVFVKELLEENDIEADDLQAVAVSSGPGSYTGLRIGASLAKGICYGSRLPLVAVSSLKSLAAIAVRDYNAGILPFDNPDDTLIVALTDARRMEVYRAVYDINLRTVLEPEAHILDDSSFAEYVSAGKTIVLVGDGAEKTYDALAKSFPGHVASEKIINANILPSAAGLADLACEALENGEIVDTAYWEPQYLKEFVAKQSSKPVIPSRN